ncbi:metallophosphoesterase [Kineothrix sp. MSJ-39]|uniref:YfcE family phosphodiesterase n=1 Tax=Kineothrix sp. MSJ-39 TaxID=2841533 RepID=UPI001C110F5F|nr:metallophosphoesterase [Kineothrix sp. MSJ-39]MBU5429911.1 metallophosphoesterase [Kineothrix sp. MSJ-39]
MKILVVSDTHRHNENYFKVIEKLGKIDLVIHCGDAEGSEYAISERAGCETLIVMGNNDFFSKLPREIETTIGKYKVWITHGHNYYVSMNSEIIKEEAVRRGVDIVFYGHSHRPVIEIGKEVIAVNPGSLSYPRQEGKRPSYVVMDIDREGEAHFNICYL